MIEFMLGIAVGLVVGWFFVPQPQWAKDMYSKIRGTTT